MFRNTGTWYPVRPQYNQLLQFLYSFMKKYENSEKLSKYRTACQTMHQRLHQLRHILLQPKTQFYLLRYYHHDGPPTENTFVHRLTCIILYHVTDWTHVQRHAKIILSMIAGMAYFGHSYMTLYGFIYCAVPEICVIPFDKPSRRGIVLCEEIGQKFVSILPL